jgi:hypothetical protein
MANELIYKGMSRCFVKNDVDIERVPDIIRQMDEFEFGNLPDEWITVTEFDFPMGVNFIEYNLGKFDHLVYNGKFDLNIDNFIQICKDFGIEVLIVTFPHPEDDFYYSRRF